MNRNTKTTTSLLFLAAVTLLPLASCSKEDGGADDMSVRFEVQYPHQTKVTDSGFESGDTCGVYMTEYADGVAQTLQVSGNVVNNAALVQSGGTWTLTPKAYWETGKKYDVYAYYPYAKPSSMTSYPFSVREDQDADEGYEQSDLLWAKTSAVQYPDVVTLQFGHLLSKLSVNLVRGDDYEGDLPDSAEVWIYNLYTEALVDLTAGVAQENGAGSRPGVKARQDGIGSYSAIVVPQRMSTRLPLVEIICGDISYLVETRMTFKAGVQHVLNVTLSNNPDRVSVEIGGEISGWE